MSEIKQFPSELLSFYTVTNEAKLQGEETLEMIIPDRYPDALSIISVDGQAWRKKREDTIQLIAEVCALIKAESGELYTITSEIPVTIRGGAEKKEENADYQIILESCQAHIINSRKISFSVEATVKYEEYSKNEVGYITGLGDGTVEKKKTYEGLLWNQIQCESFSVQDQLPYPEGKNTIKDIFRKKADITVSEKKVLQDKVLFKANADIQIYYLNEKNEPEDMTITIPFTRVMDLKGIGDEDQVEITLRSQILNVIPEKNDTQTGIAVTVNVSSIGMGYNKKAITLLEDGYSLRENLIFNRCKLSIPNSKNEIRETLKGFVTVEFSEDPDEIIGIWAETAPEIVLYDETGRVRVSFEISVSVLYRKNDDIRIVIIKKPIEWNGEIGIKNIRVKIFPGQKHYTIPTQRKSEIEVDIQLHISAEREKNIELITGVESEEKSINNQATIIITRINKETSVFALGKKYNAKPEEIAEVNRFDSEQIVGVGTRVIIPTSR